MAGRRFSALPSLESSQQIHIDDLVQQKRTLEYTIKKLNEEVELEQSRAKATISDMQAKWNAEQKQWREGCDTLQACHRIAYLRLQAELEHERKTTLFDQNVLRREKMANLQRDTSIIKFRLRENELERNVENLEEKLEETKVVHEQEIRALKERISELVIDINEKDVFIETGERAADELQSQIVDLQKSRAEKEVSSESLTAQIERANLQLDGERNKNADLERANDDFRRTNDDLKRQIEKWKSLETKGGVETETLRKRKVELEVQVQTLESKLAKRDDDLEKGKKRVENLKENRDSWETSSKNFEKQLKKVTKTLETANKEIAKFKSKLKALRITSKTPPDRLARKKPKIPEPELSEDEVEEIESTIIQPNNSSPLPPTGSQKHTSLPAKRTTRTETSTAEEEEENSDVQEVSPPPNGKGKGKARETPHKRPEPTTKQPSAKANAKASRSQMQKSSPVVPETQQDSDVEEVLPPPNIAKDKNKEKDVEPTKKKGSNRKRKATAASDDETDSSTVPQKTKRQKQDGPPQKPKSKSKPPSKAKTPVPTVDDSASNLAGTKPKRRKINLYGASAVGSAVPSLNFASDTSGLGIPTILSPVREEDAPMSQTSRFSMMQRFNWGTKK